MQWNDTAIILSVRKHGENSAVVRALASQHGVYAGVIRGANSKSNRGIIQPGNIVNLTWQARLSEHIGSFKAELSKANTAHIMNDEMKLAALSSACAMIELSLPERHPYPRLYQLFYRFLNDLLDDSDWLRDYVLLELDLLAETGFGLDLAQCAATGTDVELIYVSPKSARAVSKQAGEPYKEKLLPLPKFILENAVSETHLQYKEILAGLRLSGYFLEHSLLAPHNRKLPAVRERLIGMMKE